MIFPLWNLQSMKISYLWGLLLHRCPRLATTAALQKQNSACKIYHENVRSLCEEGRLDEALRILCDSDHALDCSTYVSLLQGCINDRALPQGKLVHAHINQMGFGVDTFLSNRLVGFYVKCGSLEDARKVFDEMPKRDYFSWNAMIAAYTRQGIANEAMELFHLMPGEGIQPNRFTFSSVLPACSDLASLERVHEKLIKGGIELDVVVESALVDMYAKFGCIESARNLFDRISHRDDVSWMVMIGGYVQNGRAEEALMLYQEMRLAGMKMNSNTFATILPACTYLGSLEQGIEIHEEIDRSGVEIDVYVGSSLVDMYAKCGRIKRARHVFDKMPTKNTVSWTVMISGCVRNGCADEALTLFHRMQLEGVTADSKTFASVLPACANSADMQLGMNIHGKIIEIGVLGDLAVSSALVDMYAKCGNVAKARDLFDKMSCRDVASWNTIVAAYSRNGPFEEALALFCQMYQAGIQPTGFTFASVLPACAKLASVEEGLKIHAKIITSGLHSNDFVENALVDMYAKCGRIDHAESLFGRMHKHNLISWNTVIGGYAIHGHGKEALELFEQMQKSGVNPDHATFSFILSTCSQMGLVEAGRQYFDCMIQHYHITPTIEHYCYMIDLHVHAGHLDEAEDLIKKQAVEPNAKLWHCLLALCRIHDNIDLEDHVAEHLLDLDSKDAASYV